MWVSGYNLDIWDLFPLLARCLFASIMVITISSSQALAQVGYSLSVLIVFTTVPVLLYQWVNESPRHFLVAETSLLVVALTQGFLSYYVFYLPGTGGSEYFVETMVLLLNAGFVGLCGYAITSNLLRKEPASQIYFVATPPNSLAEA